MDYEIIFWIGAIIVFVAVEGVTAGLVSIWFVAGSVFALIAAALGGEIWLQVTLFLLVSALALWLTRPLAKKYIVRKKTNTNADRVLDQEGIVKQAIDNIAGTGVVRVGGIDWTARSESGDIIREGTRVRSLRIEGVKIYVTPLEEPAVR